MIKFLALQVRLSRITIDDVPEQYKEAVELELSVN